MLFVQINCNIQAHFSTVLVLFNPASIYQVSFPYSWKPPSLDLKMSFGRQSVVE